MHGAGIAAGMPGGCADSQGAASYVEEEDSHTVSAELDSPEALAAKAGLAGMEGNLEVSLWKTKD